MGRREREWGERQWERGGAWIEWERGEMEVETRGGKGEG